MSYEQAFCRLRLTNPVAGAAKKLNLKGLMKFSGFKFVAAIH